MGGQLNRHKKRESEFLVDARHHSLSELKSDVVHCRQTEATPHLLGCVTVNAAPRRSRLHHAPVWSGCPAIAHRVLFTLTVRQLHMASVVVAALVGLRGKTHTHV